MMGNKKLSTIKEELREAFAKEGSNPIIELDREIRKLKKSKSAKKVGLRSLQMLRNALAQVVDEPTAKPAPTPRRKKAKTA